MKRAVNLYIFCFQNMQSASLSKQIFDQNEVVHYVWTNKVGRKKSFLADRGEGVDPPPAKKSRLFSDKM